MLKPDCAEVMKFVWKQVLALFALFCIKLLETVDTKKRLIKLRNRFKVEDQQQPSERGSCGHQKYLLRDGGKEKESVRMGVLECV